MHFSATCIFVLCLCLQLQHNYSAAAKKTQNNLVITTHHKSGTIRSTNIVAALCFQNNSYAYINTENFWRNYKRARVNCRNVSFYKDGYPFLEAIHEAKSQKALRGVTKILHFIRHPVDMLVSGYLYHKSCAEAFFWNTPLRYPIRYPDIFPVNGSYCKWLKSNSVDAGLRMELRRSLFAGDGIGNMLKALDFYQNLTSYNVSVVNICMTTFISINDLMEEVIPWNKFQRTSVEEINEQSHHSSAKAKAQLSELAFKLIAEEIPSAVLDEFPCKSEFAISKHNKVSSK
jgi:hypothetical protein